MVAKFTQGGEKLDDAIKWVENELEAMLVSEPGCRRLAKTIG
jgi:hypothetical protein